MLGLEAAVAVVSDNCDVCVDEAEAGRVGDKIILDWAGPRLSIPAK